MPISHVRDDDPPVAAEMSQSSRAWPAFDEMLVAERSELRQRFLEADPFPHLVLDGLFPPSCLHNVREGFDRASSAHWRQIHSGLQSRKVSRPDVPLPETVQDYFNIVNSGPFTRFLSAVTGIADLIPDPALYGGGMHQVAGGGTFEVHVDFEQNPSTALRNRLAVITYLNEDWDPEDGGALELWRVKPRECATVIAPLFGRTVIMGQSKIAAHGHLMPIRADRVRRSVTAYFYTNAAVSQFSAGLLPTVYFSRKGQSVRQSGELMLRLVAPPLLLGGIRMATRRLRSLVRRPGHYP